MWCPNSPHKEDARARFTYGCGFLTLLASNSNTHVETFLRENRLRAMRRTHASLCRQAGIDPKLVADQLGHGLGVNLDFYTVAGLHQRQQAVQTLEATIVRPEQPRLGEGDCV